MNQNSNKKVFSEIAVKSKIDYIPLKHYFHQNKDEFSVHNSFHINEQKFLISGFVFLKLFSDFSIKFTKIAKKMKQGSAYILLKLDDDNSNKLDQLIEFYNVIEDSSTTVLKETKMERVHLEYVIILGEVLDFYEKYSSYFSEIDNYFKMNEIASKLGCSSFIILTQEKNLKSVNHSKELKRFYNEIEFISKSINIGDDIMTINSNLGVISYDHFSNSYSKGIIGNIITSNIFLLDVRVLPNSHGAIAYKIIDSKSEVKYPFAIILPILNVKYSYTPIIYALKLSHLVEIVFDIYEAKYSTECYAESKSLDQLNHLEFNLATKPKINLIDTVFIVYSLSNYATCFYIGNGRFLTNKHFFSSDNETIYARNYKLDVECLVEFIPENNMDLAVIRIKNYQEKKEMYDGCLKKINIACYKPSVLQPVICVGFSYFNKREIMNDIKYPSQSKGIISKVITRRGVFDTHMIYQVDCTCFSGGSGGPIVDEKGDLIGVLFQNLSFQTSENFLQLPNSGFLIAKDLIENLTECIDKKGDLSKLWIFTLKNEEVDLYFNYRRFSPKF